MMMMMNIDDYVDSDGIGSRGAEQTAAGQATNRGRGAIQACKTEHKTAGVQKDDNAVEGVRNHAMIMMKIMVMFEELALM